MENKDFHTKNLEMLQRINEDKNNKLKELKEKQDR
jgi:hypothetical protein